ASSRGEEEERAGDQCQSSRIPGTEHDNAPHQRIAARSPPASAVERNRRPPLANRRISTIKEGMKLIARIQLRPAPEDAGKLKAAMEHFNAAADFVAGVAFEHRTANVFDLRKLCYAAVRERFGLSSQMAQLAIKAASDASKRDKSARVRFRKHAAVPYDQRI